MHVFPSQMQCLQYPSYFCYFESTRFETKKEIWLFVVFFFLLTSSVEVLQHTLPAFHLYLFPQSKHEVVLHGNVNKICSDVCFAHFRSLNNLSMAGCVNCGTYCHVKPLLLKMDDKTKTLCNVECLEKYKQVGKAPGFEIKKFFFFKFASFEFLLLLYTKRKPKCRCLARCVTPLAAWQRWSTTKTQMNLWTSSAAAVVWWHLRSRLSALRVRNCQSLKWKSQIISQIQTNAFFFSVGQALVWNATVVVSLQFRRTTWPCRILPSGTSARCRAWWPSRWPNFLS